MNFKSEEIIVSVDPLSIFPQLEIRVPVEVEAQKEMLVFQSAGLYTEDNRRIADVFMGTNKNNENIKYHLFSHRSNYYNQFVQGKQGQYNTWCYTLISTLSKEATDHIENIREKNPTKGVALYVEVTFQLHVTSNDLTENSNTQNNSRLEILKSIMKVERCHFTIPMSRWIQEFAEPLKIGRFLLLELRLPDMQTVNSQWKEPITRAISNLERVRDHIQHGKWMDAIETCRKVCELFKFKVKDKRNILDIKNKAALKKLFHDANLSEKGFDELCAMIENLFNFISKFEHEKDEQGGYLPTPRPQKEDAYFVYATCVAIVNLVSSKTR